jgi:hypothetical protein
LINLLRLIDISRLVLFYDEIKKSPLAHSHPPPPSPLKVADLEIYGESGAANLLKFTTKPKNVFEQ